VRTRVETTKRALDLIDEGIALLLRREHAVYDHERDAIMQGRYAACCIADRMASIAYHSLVPVQAEVRDPETPDVQCPHDENIRECRLCAMAAMDPVHRRRKEIE
jgi:hypothetical protein